MAEANLDIRFRTQGGQQSASQVEAVQSAVQRAREDVERFTKSGGLGAIAVGADKIRAAQAQIEALGHDLLTAEQRSESLRNELSRISQADIERGQADGLIQDLARSENAAASLRKELALIPRDLREQTADSVGYLGDIDSSLQAISGAADEFGQRIGGAVGGGLQVIATGARLGGELFAVAEAAPRLFSAVDQLRENMLKAVTAATAQATAQTAGTAATAGATTAESALATARRAAIIAMGGAAAAAGGVALAFAAVQLAAADSRKAAQRVIEAERTRIEIERDLANLTAEEGQRRVADLQASIQAEIEARESLIIESTRQIDTMNDVQKGLTVVGTRFGLVGTGVNDLIEEMERYTDEIDRQREEIARLNELNAARAFVEDLEESLRLENELADLRRSASVDEVQAKIEAAEQERQIQAQLLESIRQQQRAIAENIEGGFRGVELEELEKQAQAAADAMNAASAEADALATTVLPLAQAREEETAAREAEQEAIEATQAAIDDAIAAREQENEELRREIDTLAAQGQQAAEAVRASSQALADYEAELQQQAERALTESVRASQIQALETQIAAAKQTEAERAKHAEVGKALSDAAKQQRKIVADTQAEINDLNQDFMASEIKAISDFNREQKRLREDLEADLLQAATDNDVNAFIRIRDAGLRTLGRGDEDFQRERQQATDERNARIAALQEGQRAEIEQLNQQTSERLETLQAAGQAELTLSQQKEQQLLDLKEQFRLEDVRLEQEQQARQRESRLSAFRQQIEDDRAALSTILNQFNAAMQMLASSAATQGLANTALASAVGGPVAGAFAAAQGGSTFAPSISISQTVGDVATLSQAKFIANQVGQDILNGVGAIFRTGGGL